MSVYYPVTHTAPTVITLDEAKMQLKVEDLGGYDDTLIQDCIDAAIDEAERYCNINILERKFKLELQNWQQNLEFKQQYVSEITKITYKDANETAVELTETALTDFAVLKPLDKHAQVMFIKDFDNAPNLQETADAITIEFTTGYPEGNIPASIKQAIKLLITDNYDFRNDAERKQNRASRIKLEPYKLYTHE